MKFWIRLLRQDPSETSAPRAKERLKLALTYDRNGLEQGVIDQLRGELSRVMAKHLAIKAEDIQIDIDHTMDTDKLVASVPLNSARRPRTPVTASAGGSKKAPRKRR